VKRQIVYADTSALVKFIIWETETTAIREWQASEQPELITSDLGRTELIRVLRRIDSTKVDRARLLLATMKCVRIDRRVFETAALLGPKSLGTLDALHLACAVDLRDDLAAVITYDRALAEAVTLEGVRVISPTDKDNAGWHGDIGGTGGAGIGDG